MRTGHDYMRFMVVYSALLSYYYVTYFITKQSNDTLASLLEQRAV